MPTSFNLSSRQSLSPVTVHHVHHNRSQSSLPNLFDPETMESISSPSGSAISIAPSHPSIVVSPKSSVGPISPSSQVRTNALSITSTFPSNFDSIYYIDHNVILGEGYSSIVKVCYRRHQPLHESNNKDTNNTKDNHNSTNITKNDDDVDYSVAYACKIMDKTNANLDSTKWREEVFVLQHFNHPNIIRLYDVFENPTTIYLVFECAKGGELFDRICKEKKFTETNVRKIISSILRAVECLHDRGIVHRDIKPENIFFCIGKVPKKDKEYKKTSKETTSVKLLSSRSFSTSLPNNLQSPLQNETALQASTSSRPNSAEQSLPYHKVEVIKLADFGLARNLLTKPRALRAKSHVGTLGYAAPEIFSGDCYNEKCDMWSIGVICYVLLSGIAPFISEEDLENYAPNDPFWIYVNRMSVQKQPNLVFPEKFFRDVSDGAKNFTSSLLELNPSRRLRASEALRHPWLLKGKNSKPVLKAAQRTWTVAESQQLKIVSASTPTASASRQDVVAVTLNNEGATTLSTLSPSRRFSRQPTMPTMPEEILEDE